MTSRSYTPHAENRDSGLHMDPADPIFAFRCNLLAALQRVFLQFSYVQRRGLIVRVWPLRLAHQIDKQAIRTWYASRQLAEE